MNIYEHRGPSRIADWITETNAVTLGLVKVRTLDFEGGESLRTEHPFGSLVSRKVINVRNLTTYELEDPSAEFTHYVDHSSSLTYYYYENKSKNEKEENRFLLKLDNRIDHSSTKAQYSDQGILQELSLDTMSFKANGEGLIGNTEGALKNVSASVHIKFDGQSGFSHYNGIENKANEGQAKFDEEFVIEPHVIGKVTLENGKVTFTIRQEDKNITRTAVVPQQLDAEKAKALLTTPSTRRWMRARHLLEGSSYHTQ